MSTIEITGFTSCLLSSIVMGLSCGSGCSPMISMFLTGYVVQAEGDSQKTGRVFVRFFMGKALAVLIVCLTASLVGEIFVNEGGYFGKYKFTYLMPIFLIISGIYMLMECIRRSGKKECSTCGSCKRDNRITNVSPLIGGFFYGLTPCAPLIIISGYALTMFLWQALILGIVFSITCTLAPFVLIFIITKLVMNKMQEEVPKMFGFVRYGIYVMIIITGVIMLFS
ncbi:hypothetical protein [Anaerosacchariphilus polymeriproducens]|uniref:Urease accessory protein UreH-like transmembrane domain-containing protein n=1 Tax=Anaerosacchariphilus polymeriproducens TaxID=1812858 RepID=A0A371AZG1_9FIRM|nr:hypothetical protein [Anaerosacchariphilus polymeriproducens]RDU24998.1 hypothetical protein DWV06_01865 [Anaerosacchariphilus polymeriproducens]